MPEPSPHNKRQSENALIESLAFFHDDEVPTEDFLSDVLEGLSQSPPSLPAKYFYDETGARLFEKICETGEYYVTRTEMALLEERAPDMARHAGQGATIVEFGSGALRKIRLLLKAFHKPFGAVAIDISRAQLVENAARMSRDFPRLRVGAICADFTKPIDLAHAPSGDGRRVGFLPGSTIGNFTPEARLDFLKSIRQTVGADGALLIGVDLKKSAARLEAAYNDREGFTAAFNRNILTRIARELGAEIVSSDFAHEAFYNEKEGRVEMHLRATRAQTISINGHAFPLQKGERIHTENSYKYDMDEFRALARRAGFSPSASWTDQHRLFSLHWLEAAEGRSG